MTRIKEAKSPEHNQNASNSSNIYTTEFLFFIAINILLVGISTYQTYIGYKADVGGNSIISGAIALTSGLLFLAINFSIREHRLKGKRHFKHLLLYIIPLGFSFLGNFNAFYINQTGDDFLRHEIRKYQVHLTQTYNEAIVATNKSEDLLAFENANNSALNQLDVEFNRPPKGWGTSAEQRWKDLTNLLNNNGGNINPNIINNIKNENDKFDRANAFGKLEYDNIVNAKKSRIQPVIDNINREYSTHHKIDSLISLPTPQYNTNMLTDMATAENNIRSIVTSFLGSSEQDVFSKTQLDLSFADNIGTIKYTFHKAFIEKEQPAATIFSFFISLIIDLAGLLYVLVLIPYERRDRIRSRGRMPQKI